LPLVESLRVTDTLRHQVAARDLSGLAAEPSLADRAKALVQSHITNEEEVGRVLGL
jgi:hypothetical protein